MSLSESDPCDLEFYQTEPGVWSLRRTEHHPRGPWYGTEESTHRPTLISDADLAALNARHRALQLTKLASCPR